MRMMRVVDVQEIAAFLDVVGAAEKDVDFFERHLFGFGAAGC